MKIPFLNLKSQYAALRPEIEKALLRVAESQHFVLGPEVKIFENSISKYLGVKNAIGVSSGTDALLISLMAIEIKPGDEVIVPDYSFFATAGAVARLQATPVFVDIDPETYNMDPSQITAKITRKTKAIIPVHLYGQCAAMDEILKIAREQGLKVIEDSAQSLGAQYRDGRIAGTMGDIGCYSFFPSKNLGGFGDGGLVTTQDEELAERMKILRVHGGKPKYHHKIIGGNFRLDAIQAAVLDVKLPHLDEWSAGRQNNADYYTKLFSDAGLTVAVEGDEVDRTSLVCTPKPIYRSDGLKSYHIYNQYVIRAQHRDRLRQHLQEKEIGSEMYYPIPFHRQGCFMNLKASGFPNSIEASENTLALPIYPELNRNQIEYVVDCISEFYRKN